jgi:hypothetical protein
MTKRVALLVVYILASVGALGQHKSGTTKWPTTTSTTTGTGSTPSLSISRHYRCHSKRATTALHLLLPAATTVPWTGPLVPGLIALYVLTVADYRKEYLLTGSDPLLEKAQIKAKIVAFEAQILAMQARARAYSTTQQLLDEPNRAKAIRDTCATTIEKAQREIQYYKGLTYGMELKVQVYRRITTLIHRLFFPWLGLLVKRPRSPRLSP